MMQGIVTGLEERRRRAFLDGDESALGDMLDDALEYVHSSGSTDGKASFLAAIRRGALKYVDLRFTGVTAIAAGPETITLRGGMAGVVQRNDGRINVEAWYVAVWCAVGGGWRLRYFQSTRRPPG